jgi:N-acetyl-alpha-D-glucosaminyl L-malate synthase BshA
MDIYHSNIYYHEVEIPHYPLFEFHLYTLALAGKIADVAKYEKLDLIHSHYAIPHAISAHISKEILDYDLKLITTLHGTDVTLVGQDRLFVPIVSYGLQKSDAITAVSNHLKEQTLEKFEVNKDIDVIPNFINTNIYKRELNNDLKRKIAPKGEKILMHISNFRPVKRVTDVILAFSHVLEETDAKLIMVGDGPDRAEAERLADDLRIMKYIKFLGKQNITAELISLADVFLLTSELESFGLAALEAMACGVPVVSTNVGGLPEVIEDGKSGFMVNVGNVKAMADFALRLIKNPNLWNEVSKNSINRAKDSFNSDKIVNRYEELYYRVKEQSEVF